MHLPRINDEVLAQQRQAAGLTHAGQVFRAAMEARALGQDGQARGPRLFVFLRDLGGFVIGPQDTGGRRRFLISAIRPT